MEDLAVFIALNHSGSFRMCFVKFKKKKCYLPAKGRSVWPRAAFSRPRSQFFTIRTSQLANNIYLFARDKEKSDEFPLRRFELPPVTL